MSQGVSLEVSVCLHRVSWLLHARVVEAKLIDLRRAVKAGFDPNEPRVPAGSGRESGQWTGIGSGTRIAQNIPPEEEIREGENFEEATQAQVLRLTIAQARRNAAVNRVHEPDRNWQPTPNLTETIEGEILAAESEAQEATARLQELAGVGIGRGPFAGESIPARGPSRNFTVGERVRSTASAQ